MKNLAKIARNLPRAPVIAAERLRVWLMMAHYRQIATLGSGARVLTDGRLFNPACGRERIIVGARSVIRGELFSAPQGGGIRLGHDCFVGHGTYIWAYDAAGITIGDRVLISHGVNIHDSNSHSLDAELRAAHFQAIARNGHPQFVPDISTAPITIESDAWICYGSSIAKGVTVGEGAIVSRHSVVLRDVEPWTVVAGFPAAKVTNVRRSTR